MLRATHLVSIGALVLVAISAIACGNNMFTGNLTPVPPVHHVPSDVSGAVILINTDPIIESKDPRHAERANEQRLPQHLRTAMEEALAIAGFRVTSKSSDPHDLVAKLAINVTEFSEYNIRQVYRCGLTGADGTFVAQIDWMWPSGVYVGDFEVLEFATHNLATEVATSRPVSAYLRAKRSTPVGTPNKSESDAGD